MRVRVWCVVALTAAGGLLAACSGDDDDGPLVDALTVTMVETARSQGTSTDHDRTRCTAEAFVEVLGPGALTEAGVTVEALEGGEFAEMALWEMHAISEGEAGRMVQKLFDCTDAAEMLAEELEADGLPRGIGDCVAREVLQKDAYRRHVADDLRGSTTENFAVPLADMQPTMARCASAGD